MQIVDARYVVMYHPTIYYNKQELEILGGSFATIPPAVGCIVKGS